LNEPHKTFLDETETNKKVLTSAEIVYAVFTETTLEGDDPKVLEK